MNLIVWKTGLALSALFGLGVATGFVIARRTAATPVASTAATPASGTTLRPTNTAWFSGNFAQKWSERRLGEYREIIHPTAAQEAAIKRHFDDLQTKYAGIKKETGQEIVRVVTEMNKGIAAELTPQQRKAFWEYLKQYEQKGEH